MPDLLTVSQAANFIGVTVKAIYLAIEEGRINSVEILNKKGIPKAEAKRYKRQRSKTNGNHKKAV